MKCCGSSSSKTLSPDSSPYSTMQENLEHEAIDQNVKHEAFIQIPGCTVHLMDEGEAVEIAKGDFTLLHVSDQNLSLATVIKVGEDLQWPLTKDEPVVKLDSLHYLFTLPIKDGDPLSYGVTFLEQYVGRLASLDSFLGEHSCFSCPSNSTLAQRNNIDWKQFAPKIEDYNGVLAKAIAGGTGQIVRGIFICSNAYTNQVQKGGELILTRAAEEKPGTSTGETKSNQKKTRLNRSLKRVRKLSKMTQKVSKVMLDGVGVATGSVMGPLVRSKAGQAFFNMMPGEVLLASLDAVDKVMNAAEAAENQALSATSGAAVRMVSNRFGENAGEATDDVLATAGHAAGTAWNIFKIRKAINPASSVSSGILKTVTKTRQS
ncbi:hypothetical protein Ancab_028552 [Ancistrocladus abbreviatus]